jgi:hypothetical protein
VGCKAKEITHQWQELVKMAAMDIVRMTYGHDTAMKIEDTTVK